MTAVAVSPEYQVVIPREMRESMGITAGQQMQVLTCRGRIERVPIKPISGSRGLLPGLYTDLEKDDDRP